MSKRRWTEVLCQKCGGNGVIKIQGGVSTCPRCDGRCYDPEAAGAAPAPSPETKEAAVDRIVHLIGQRYRTFGGGRDSDTNPLAHALKNEPLSFAANVDVRAVVEFVYDELRGVLASAEGEQEK